MREEPVARAGVPDVDALYRAHVGAIFGFIYLKVGSREAAEDLTSEVFIKALTHLDPARQEASIVAWLYRVARTTVADYWRGVGRTPVIAIDDVRDLRSAPGIPDGGRQEQTAARANALLTQLPDNYRTVLSCRLLQGMSVAETADAMGTSQANVKVLQHRALKRAAELREGTTGGR